MNAKLHAFQVLGLFTSLLVFGAEEEAARPAKTSASSIKREVHGSGVIQPEKVNVRGQATLKSEVVTQLSRGDQVEIVEEIVLAKSKTGEPSKWYKIVLPTNTPVWVNLSFIDPSNKTVIPKKLNVRSGPGENFSILATIEKGAEVKEISVKETWMEIVAPTNAYAFLAAELVKADLPPAPEEKTEPTTVVPTVLEPIITNIVETPKTVPETVPPDSTANVTTPLVTNSPVVAVPPPKKRIVLREGIVKRTVSIQAPTYFELESKETGRIINYLHPRNPELKLKAYLGARVIVSGEEYLDERWPRTPVLDVESIELP